MKRILVILLALIMTISLFACGKNNEVESQSDTPVEEDKAEVPNSEQQEGFSANEENYPESFKDNYPDRSSLNTSKIENLTEEEWYWADTDNYKSVKVDPRKDSINIEGYFAEFLPPVNNTIALEKLLYPCAWAMIRVYDEITNYEFSPLIDSYYWRNIKADGKKPNFPELFLRQVEGSNYYTVQKIKDGGWLYIFYDREKDPATGKYSGDDITVIECKGCVYLEKVLSYDDFGEISIGSKMSDVAEIDPIVYSYELSHDITANKGIILLTDDDIATMNSRHLLTDGLLTIYYRKISGEYVVYDMDFSEEFVFNSPYLEKSLGYPCPRQFKILPQDYPPAS